MKMNKSTLIIAIALLATASSFAKASNLVILYQFKGGRDGAIPSGGLTRLHNGTIVGTTSAGGSSNAGTVFSLSQQTGQGAWTKTTVWSFGAGSDGEQPQGGLVQDYKGDLYGTTLKGGKYNAGTLFRLSPPAAPGGAWSKTGLWNFGANGDGSAPSGALAIRSDGTIFGTTYSGGSNGLGTAYAIYADVTNATGVSESVIWDFTGRSDGMIPTSIVINQFGTLIGCASEGGQFGYGSVYVLQPPIKFNLLGNITPVWSFSGSDDGRYPTYLASDSAGSFYETLAVGPNQTSAGSVFKLTYQNGKWTGGSLLTFPGGEGGANPSTILAVSKNVLIGTTSNGGANSCAEGHVQTQCGVAFSLTRPAKPNLSWNEQILWDFSPIPAPQGISGPIIPYGPSGYIGETSSGGSFGAGALFYIQQ